jgi:hypothetical protein
MKEKVSMQAEVEVEVQAEAEAVIGSESCLFQYSLLVINTTNSKMKKGKEDTYMFSTCINIYIIICICIFHYPSHMDLEP